MTKVLIIGAGHAGGSAAAFLRQYGFEGQIVLAGEEPAAPYQRPPLSKAWLKGEAGLEDLLLRPESFYEEQVISLRTGVRATAINRAGKTVTFADGTIEGYDTLILALGSTARRLEGLDQTDGSKVRVLRTMQDAEGLKAALTPGTRLAVVGAGYVGLEASASARGLGCEVEVVERESRPLARVASETLGWFMGDYHAKKGVRVETGVAVTGLADVEGGVAVRTEGGADFVADLILVGVGGAACHGLALEAGLICENGVVVDEAARTSDPNIYALGDMTWRPMPVYDGARARLESVPNALEQAKQAAAAIVGRAGPMPEVPWFWSDQYELKIQIAGLPIGADRQVVRGWADASAEAPSFAVFHLAGDRIVCVEAVNAPAEFMAGRMMIGKQTPVDSAKLADPDVSMKAVAAG